MKTQLSLLISFYLFFATLKAQNSDKQNTDSSRNPIWIKMMMDDKSNFQQTQKAFNRYWQNREIKKGSGYKVFKRWEYIRRMEVDSSGYLIQTAAKKTPEPSGIDRFNSSGFSSLSAFDSMLPCQYDSSWMETGPYNLNNSGRINALAFHPLDSNTILAAAPSGGLWRTKDGGKTWKLILNKLPTLGISAVIYDHSNPDIIYIGTGDAMAGASPGFGIYKSIDGGDNWNAINNGLGNTTVSKICQDPIQNNILLCAANGRILRSRNGGQSWTYSSITPHNVKDLIVHPKFSHLVYASNGGNFYKSTDSGKTFTHINKGIPDIGYRGAIAITEDDSSYVYFLQCDPNVFKGVYRSVNFGDSFSLMASAPNLMDYSSTGSGSSGQAFYCMDIAVHPKKKDEVYVGGINIFKSINGGKNWSINAHWFGDNAPYVHADIHALEFHPFSNALFAACDGGVFSNAVKWTSLSPGLGVHQSYKISTCETGKVVSGFQDNGTLSNNKLDSKQFTELNDGDGMDNYIDFKDPSNVYTSLQNGVIYRNYTIIAKKGQNGITEDGDWLTPFVLMENNTNKMFAGFKNIWRSGNLDAGSVMFENICDAGSTSTTEFVSDIENSPANNRILFFSRSNGNFYKTNHANANKPKWVNLTSQKPTSGMINDIQCDYKDSNTVYIAIGTKVYHSADGGNTWANYSNNLPNVIVYSMAIDTSSKNKTMFCGTSNGVYYRDSVIGEWRPYNKNFPAQARVTDIEISYGKNKKSSSRLVAGTYGRGIWQTPLPSYQIEKPIAKFGRFASPIICKYKSIRFTDSSEGLNILHKWSCIPNTVTFENGDSVSENARIFFNQKGRYSVFKMVKNCHSIDTFLMDDVLVLDSAISTTCKGTTTFKNNPGQFGIRSLGIGSVSIASNSTLTGGEYEDNSCKGIFYVKPGQNHAFSISVNSQVYEYVKVYIDLNNDGVFKESEIITSFNAKGSYYGNINIPDNITKNKPIRVRAISDYAPIDTTSCPTLSFGQTEDHILYAQDESANYSVSKKMACLNETIVFSDSSDGLFNQYLWQFGEGANPQTASGKGPHNVQYSSSGYKTVVLNLNNGIQIKKDSGIYVKPHPSANISEIGSDSIFCEGQNIQLLASKSSDVQTIKWLMNQTAMGNQDTLRILNASTNDSGNYQVIVSDGCSLDTSEIYHLKIKPTALANFEINSIQQCFKNHQFICSEKVNSLISHFIEWKSSEGFSSTSTNATVTFINGGQKTISLYCNSSNGCRDTMTKTVEVFPMPDTAFQILRQSFRTYRFIPKDTGNILYHWKFGDGNSSAIKQPIHTYSSSLGNFDVKLKVITSNACIDSQSRLFNLNETGLQPSRLFENVLVYPNPGSRYLSIKTQSQHIDKAYTLQLLNSEGKVLYQLRDLRFNTQFEFTIDLFELNLCSGFYILNLSNDNQSYSHPIILTP